MWRGLPWSNWSWWQRTHDFLNAFLIYWFKKLNSYSLKKKLQINQIYILLPAVLELARISITLCAVIFSLYQELVDRKSTSKFKMQIWLEECRTTFSHWAYCSTLEHCSAYLMASKHKGQAEACSVNCKDSSWSLGVLQWRVRTFPALLDIRLTGAKRNLFLQVEKHEQGILSLVFFLIGWEILQWLDDLKFQTATWGQRLTGQMTYASFCCSLCTVDCVLIYFIRSKYIW